MPIRIRLLGTPGEAELDRLSDTVAAAVSARLVAAGRLLAERHGPGVGARAHERFDPDRDGAEGYAVPSYRDGGEPVAVPVRARTRPWVVLRAHWFRTTVADFLDWLEHLRGAPLADRVLYPDQDTDVRWVTVWWVQANRTTTLGKLAEALYPRATELSRAGPRRTLAHGIAATDAGRLELAQLDPSGQVRALPELDRRNAHRLDGSGPDAELLHGGRAVFAFMPLPVVELTDVLTLAPGTSIDLPLRELRSLVQTDELAEAFHVDWDTFVAAFPAEVVRVALQPATVRRAEPPAVLLRLLSTAVPVPGTDGVPLAGLWALTDAALAALPPAVRRLALDWTDAGTRALDASLQLDRLPAGVRVLFATATLPVDADRAGAARQRAQALQIADELRRLLDDYPDDRRWRWRAYDLLGDRFGRYPPATRPVGGTLFEHVLAALEQSGDLVRLYDAADATGFFGLRHRLLRLSLPTVFANHPRVVRLREALFEGALAVLAHDFFPDTTPPKIHLDRDPGFPVAVGEVFGDVQSIYLKELEQQELKPDRAAALRAACSAAMVELVRELDAGTNGTEYTAEEFSLEVVARAARAAGITEDDFVDLTIERSIQLVDVRHRTLASLPSYEVAFRFVERRVGGDWVVVSDVFVETADEFSARLNFRRLGPMGEFLETAGLVLTGVALLAVAWEAGIVAWLVKLGGGAVVVVSSVAIAEAIYLLRVVFGDAKLTARGVLTTALEGYLGALGFRAGGALGKLVGPWIGTASVHRVFVGWVLEKLVTGVVGGAVSAGLTTFAHDVIDIARGRGGWSSPGAYVQSMAVGAAVGVVVEFFAAPALRAVLERASGVLADVPALARHLVKEGWGAVRLPVALTEGLAAMRAALTELAGARTAAEFVDAFAARVGPLLQQMVGGAVARRVLELSGAKFTRAAAVGLERFLAAAESASPQRAFAIAKVFGEHAQPTVHFLEVLAELDQAVIRRLVDGTFGSRGDLAAFLGRLARYTPEQQRAAIRLLSQLDIQVGEPVPGLSPGVLLQRQLDQSLRLQAAGLDEEATRLRTLIERLEQQRERVSPGNTKGRERLERAIADNGELLARRTAEAEERLAAGTTVGDLAPTDAELEAALSALEAGAAGPEAGATAWIRVRAAKLRDHPTFVERLVRPLFRSRTGNRVVFRIQGGTGNAASPDFVRVDPATGNVRIHTGGRRLHLNFGVFERAIEFLVESRPGARLMVFEVEEAWFRSISEAASPERGVAATLREIGPSGASAPLPAGPKIRDVRGLPRTVDVTTGADQVQLPGELVPELQEFVIPGSGRVLEFQ